MVVKKNRKAIPPQKPSLLSHRAHCSVCAHPEREEIEREYISWKSPADIVIEHRLRNRSAVYRHALALDLTSKRARNIRAALEHIIEKAYTVSVTAGAVVQAIALYGRINSRGELVERGEQASLHDLFADMNPDELEAYAREGTLPNWFTQITGTKVSQDSGGKENGQASEDA